MPNTGLDLLFPIPWFAVLGRLALAILTGGLIGLERQLDHKPAGLRTHMLVSLGAALFVLIGVQTGILQSNADGLSRLMQGLITGIGFLGAGEIVAVQRKGHRDEADVRVQGLTSAAAIWVSAALGTAAGCGLWTVSLLGATLTVTVLWSVKKLESKIRS
jgi:putative Mg2+ transporter-C (MgtC) family protein